MKRTLFLLITGILCVLSVGVALLGLHLFNTGTTQQRIYNDTLFVKDIARNVVIQKVVQTSIARNNPQEEKEKTENQKVEKALKRGMKILEDGLLEQGFTKEMVALYIGRWNNSFDLLLTTLKARSKETGVPIEEGLNTQKMDINSEELEQFRALVLSTAISSDPERAEQVMIMFTYVLGLGLHYH